MHLFRRAISVLLLAIAACSTSDTQGIGVRPRRATPPPADYTHISSSDVSHNKKIEIGVNTDLIDGDEEGKALSPFRPPLSDRRS